VAGLGGTIAMTGTAAAGVVPALAARQLLGDGSGLAERVDAARGRA
jgi:hypothetical protein